MTDSRLSYSVAFIVYLVLRNGTLVFPFTLVTTLQQSSLQINYRTTLSKSTLLLSATRQSKQEVEQVIKKLNLKAVPKKKLDKSIDRKQHNFTLPSLRVQLNYHRDGHACIRSFLSPTDLEQIREDLLNYAEKNGLEAWRQKVEVASNSPELAAACFSVRECRERLDQLGVTWDALPFLQHFNTHRSIDSVRKLCYNLGEAAAVLMDVPKIRLYQDSLFWKRSQDGATPWHTDARMAPFDTSNMITFWIPLQDVPKDGTALLFVSKSHSDFALPFWNKFVEGSGGEYDRLQRRYKKTTHYMPLKLGDATIHAGFTLHCSDGNDSNEDRLALAISYVDAHAEIREEAADPAKGSQDDGSGYGDNEDSWSYKDWVSKIKPRTRFEHDLVPIVWPVESRTNASR